jgi:hypothetical protein
MSHCQGILVYVWVADSARALANRARLPKTWVVGSTCAALAALAMGAYDDALGNAARAVFSASGPLLSLSVALFLAESGKRDNDLTTPTTARTG